jgi:macrolide transport system ATP-binding/permease protein
MDALLQDLRYGFRMLGKSPGFTAVAVLSLALGIGVNSTIFSLVNAVLLRPLPVEEPDTLVRLYATTSDGTSSLKIPYQDYADYRDQNQVFSGLAGVALTPLTLNADNQTEQLLSEIVSGNYFSVLGVRAAPGRTFLSDDEDRADGNAVVVISHDLWQRRFAADPASIGKIVYLNGNPFTIIGVAARDFKGTFAGAFIDAWVPVIQSAAWLGPGALTDRNKPALHAIGRLKPGVADRQAQAAMITLAGQLEQAYPETNRGKSIKLGPATLVHGNRRNAISSFLAIMLMMVALVLLIACANVANLMLTRTLGRRRELAVRMALGATRGRLIRHLLTESVLLSLLGGAAGLVAAVWATDLLAAFNPIPSIPLKFDLSLDRRVLGFTLFVSFLTGVILGLAPAIRASKWELATVLKDEAGSLAGDQHKSRLRNFLAVTQVAVSVVLLISAGLFLKSLQRAESASPGFEPENALAMDIDLKPKNLSPSEGIQLYENLIARIEALPGVQSVSLADLAPLDIATSMTAVNIEGYQPPPGQSSIRISSNKVGLRYFQTLSIPLLAGRDFDERDGNQASRVVIINETMARRYFAGEDATGKRFRIGNEMLPVEVIGIAADVKYRTIGEDPAPHLYLPFLQNYSAGMTLLARTAGDPKPMLQSVQRELQVVDKDVQGFFARTLIEHMGFSLLPSRLAATLFGIFGLLALFLAVIGIYGVLSYAVTQRTREIGIRLALGARASDVFKLVVGQGMMIVITGVIAGTTLSFAVTRIFSSLLFKVSATDPLIFLIVSLALGAVAMIACYIPARRATKVDPMIALRYEQ